MRPTALLVCLVACSAPDVGSRTEAIVGGTPVGSCGFPTTVLVGGGCTGTLVHPRVVVTAAHCGFPSSVQFGERSGSGPTRSVECRAVPGFGTGADVQFCVLDSPVDLPVTPILYGCELEELVVGTEVVITGFGRTSFENTGSFGIQRWNYAPIRDVRTDVTLIGTPSTSACPGDSGGPVFIEMEDGSWRVFGSVSGGTTGIPCNGDGAYPRLENHVPWFEETFGIDITPCHDVDGSWNPSAECTGFFAGDHTGGESWSDMCAGAPASGPSATCGAPYAEVTPDAGPEPDAGSPDSGTPDAGMTDAGGADAAGVDAGPLPDGGSVDSGDPSMVVGNGCGCRAPGSSSQAPGWLFLALLGLLCRRRSSVR